MTPIPTRPAPPAFLVTAIVGWLDGLAPGEFTRLAETEANVAPALMGRWPAWQVRLARGLIGPVGEQTLHHAGADTWEALLDELLRVRPDAGLAAWAHRDWFLAQMAEARDLFLRS